MQRTAMILGVLFAASPAAADTNHCELAVTGDTNATIKVDISSEASKGKVAAQSDYWLSEQQLRSVTATMVGIGAKLTPEEKQKKIDEALKHDPRFMLLVINCLADEGGVIFTATASTKYADLPMKPGTIPLVTSSTRKQPGLNLMFHVSPGGQRESYALQEPSKLVLTQFDRKGIAGTFTFKAAQQFDKKKKHVNVVGSFRYACEGQNCQK